MKGMIIREQRTRIKKIDAELEKLSKEKWAIYKLLKEIEEQDLLKEHKKYIGRYFKTTYPKCRYDYVYAFKVLKIDSEDSNLAICLALIDGKRNRCKEIGITRLTIDLWELNSLSSKTKDDDSKVIDCCEEITEQEFIELYNDFYKRIDHNNI